MDDYDRARELALRFLDFQARTTTEVRRRLARAEVPDDIADAVIADLTAAGLLDDSRFSQAWIADRSVRKGYGRTRLAAELRVRGVDKEVIDEAVETVDADNEFSAAMELARNRSGAEDLSDPAARRRLIGYLRRRGYEWEVIERVLAALGDPENS